MVSDAAATKAPIAKIADKVSGIFVPAVILSLIHIFDTLNDLAAVRSDDVKKSRHLENESLPGWTTEKTDIKSIYLSRIKNISKTGYGICFHCNHLV